MSKFTGCQSYGKQAVKPNMSTYKLLMIGNSFAADAAHLLKDICTSAGVPIVVGVINIGGCSLQQHWERIENNEEAPFQIWRASGKTDVLISYDDVIRYENWDVITFQQFSGDSGKYETFQPYVTHLRDYAQKLATNAEVAFGWHSTWAYAGSSEHPSFEAYDHDQMSMYASITNASKQVMENMGFDVMIPSGTAIQNARTNDELKEIGDELTLDGHHLDQGIGSFVAGLTLFETLIAKRYRKDLFKDITFFPLGGSKARLLGELAKKAAQSAVETPFEVTDI